MTRPTSRVSRVLMSGPLAPFAEEYRLELMARGYTVRSAVNELRQVARLSRWLGNRGLGARDLSREQIEEFLAFQRRSGRLRSQSRPGLLCLLGVLQARCRRRASGTAAFGGRTAAFVLRALPAGRAWAGGRHCRRLPGSRGTLSRRPACRRAAGDQRGRGVAGGAEGVSLGGGRHCAELHLRAAGLPGLLVPRGLCRGGPLAGGSRRATPAVLASPRARPADPLRDHRRRHRRERRQQLPDPRLDPRPPPTPPDGAHTAAAAPT